MDRNTMIFVGLLALIALAVLYGWFRRWVRSTARADAGSMLGEVYPVWASQGPFSSGAESARAMRFAWRAVFGGAEAEKMSDQISGSAQAFDTDPQEWEALRRESLAKRTAVFDAHVAEVRQLQAVGAYFAEWIELMLDGTLTLFNLKSLFTVEDVDQAYRQKKEALTADPPETERARLEDRYRPALHVAQLDAAAEATGDAR